MLGHPAQYLPQVMLLLLQGLAPNQHVIHIDKAVLKAFQHLIHEELETLACIPQPKWHAY